MEFEVKNISFINMVRVEAITVERNWPAKE